MSSATPIDIAISKLIELLTLEKSRLLGGSYDDIPEITEQKQFYLSVLMDYIQNPAKAATLKPFSKAIEEIKALSNENEALFNAARNGVKAAQTRLKSIATRESLVGAYTADGSKLRAHDCGVTRCKTA